MSVPLISTPNVIGDGVTRHSRVSNVWETKVLPGKARDPCSKQAAVPGEFFVGVVLCAVAADLFRTTFR